MCRRSRAHPNIFTAKCSLMWFSAIFHSSKMYPRSFFSCAFSHAQVTLWGAFPEKRRWVELSHVNCGGFFNAFILRNKMPSDELTKSFGMRYSSSHADPGLKMREHLCFWLFWLWSETWDPATNPGLHRQSNLPQSLHRPCLLQSFIWLYSAELATGPRTEGYRGSQFFRTNRRSGRASSPGHQRGSQRL
jgi:hypothetical protein